MFNVRVYGIMIQQGRVLLCKEFIRQTKVVKFPGGGLEQGEGPVDCLKREFSEELGFTPELIRHFYTTEFYVQSIVNPNDQVISIYYLVGDNISFDLQTLSTPELSFFWKELNQLSENDLSLPIDKHVAKMLIGRFISG